MSIYEKSIISAFLITDTLSRGAGVFNVNITQGVDLGQQQGRAPSFDVGHIVSFSDFVNQRLDLDLLQPIVFQDILAVINAGQIQRNTITLNDLLGVELAATRTVLHSLSFIQFALGYISNNKYTCSLTSSGVFILGSRTILEGVATNTVTFSDAVIIGSSLSRVVPQIVTLTQVVITVATFNLILEHLTSIIHASLTLHEGTREFGSPNVAVSQSVLAWLLSNQYFNLGVILADSVAPVLTRNRQLSDSIGWTDLAVGSIV